MINGDLAFLTAAVVIFCSIAALVGYAIKRLSGAPTRIAAVIIAITGLVAAMPPVLDALQGAPQTATVIRTHAGTGR